VPEKYTRHPNSSCIICGKQVYRRKIELEKNNGRVFCSSKCYGKACRKEIACLICKKPILSGANKKTCSRTCANKHRIGIKYKLGAPRKDKVKSYRALKLRLAKARGQKCERCGYSKYDILQIHHKDRDRSNNELDNLELICPNCHYEEHFLNRETRNNLT
jgi:predicted nucleic acid-binding Zn ribbon protein